jgi:hypothetical protein
LKDEIESCSVKVEGPRSFEENVEQIKQRFAAQGWTFVKVIRPLNESASLIFTRPKATA